MTTERTDHAQEALSCIGLLAEIGYAADHGYRKQEYLAEAQVHATLALVEQQRIANLIALGTAETGPYRYLDAGRTELRSEDAFGAAAHLLGIEEVKS